MPRPLSPLVTCVRLACHMSGTVYGNTADGFRFFKGATRARLFTDRRGIGSPTTANTSSATTQSEEKWLI